MKKIFVVMIVGFGLIGCSSKSVSSTPQVDSSEYNKSVNSQLEEALKKCAVSSNPSESTFHEDWISFKIFPDGKAREGIAYRSRNEITKPWAYCIENEVKQMKFSAPPNGKEYLYQTQVDWDAVVAANPKLLDLSARIRQTMSQNRSSFQQCYRQALESGGRETGKVNLNLEVKSDGTLQKVHTESNEIKDSKLLSCLETATAKFKFPKSSEKGIYKVVYPVVFGHLK